MSFKIKNHTTDVPVERTAAELEALLIRFGATRIMKEYDAGWLKGVSFILPVEWGKMPVTLPASVDGVYKAIMKERKANPRTSTVTDAQAYKFKEQAERVAWRLMLDWAKVQLSLITCHQAEPAQVFMPFCVMGENDGKPVTMFQVFKENQMKALKPHPPEGGA